MSLLRLQERPLQQQKCPKRCVAGTARPGQLGELALEHLAAARELQRALETSCFASTLQAEGKS